MNSHPLVSIVVPVYNGERYLRQALDSILAQTYTPIEVIVTDDASTDGTPDVIASFGDRVCAIRQDRNLGQFENVNAGIALARGSFIAVYHADDVYDPDILEREVAFLERYPQVGAVFCLDRFIDATGDEYRRRELPADVPVGQPIDYPTLVALLLEHRNVFLRTPGALARAAVYSEVGGFPVDRGSAGDLEMWLRIARHRPIAILDEHLFGYRHFHGSVGQSYQHVRVEPENFFDLMDEALAHPAAGTPPRSALAAYLAHRAQDRLFCAVNLYIRGERGAARAMLRGASAKSILGSRRVQRLRMLVLTGLMHVATRLPRIRPLAYAFRRRWHPHSREAGTLRSGPRA